jgi:vancomycin permeability regulator SanA
MTNEEKSICFVVMGARVMDDGQPSGAMTRRVNAAIDSGRMMPGACFLVTGGVGKSKFCEADAMRSMLIRAGIPGTNIISEAGSGDTLSSVINCSLILKGNRSFDLLRVVTDIYHLPRCRWLFFLSGVSTSGILVSGGLKSNGLIKWIYFYLRELLAIPWDTLLFFFKSFKR